MLGITPGPGTPAAVVKGKPVEAGIDQRHRALRVQRQTGCRSVGRIQHEAVGDDGNGLTGMALRKLLQCRTATRKKRRGLSPPGTA